MSKLLLIVSALALVPTAAHADPIIITSGAVVTLFLLWQLPAVMALAVLLWPIIWRAMICSVVTIGVFVFLKMANPPYGDGQRLVYPDEWSGAPWSLLAGLLCAVGFYMAYRYEQQKIERAWVVEAEPAGPVVEPIDLTPHARTVEEPKRKVVIYTPSTAGVSREHSSKTMQTAMLWALIAMVVAFGIWTGTSGLRESASMRSIAATAPSMSKTAKPPAVSAPGASSNIPPSWTHTPKLPADFAVQYLTPRSVKTERYDADLRRTAKPAPKRSGPLSDLFDDR